MNPPQKIGRYEILEELGHGAMGAVYRAKDPAMDRIVALKTIISTVLAGEQGSEFRERFFREARAAGQLTHPGIVPVFDMGEHDGSPFMVMEYVNGWTLANAAAQGVRLDLNRMCEIGQEIAEALGYAHRRGVVHRDIKPANILLTSRESYGAERPKITDFGIAKLTESEATMTGKMLGTPAFMPPEQFTGAPLDGRADIFSLGVVLYWLATGEQPFPGEGLTAILYKVVHTDPIPPRKLNPALPARFESIVMKCIEKDPAARYQTAEELAHELEELRTGKSVTQPPVAAARTAAVRTGAMWTPGSINDADATLIEPIRGIAQPADAPADTLRQIAAAPAPTGRQRSPYLAIAVIVAVLVAFAGWFAIRMRQKTPAQPIPPYAGAIPATPASPAAKGPTVAPAQTPALPPAPGPAAAETQKPSPDQKPAAPGSSTPGSTAPGSGANLAAKAHPAQRKIASVAAPIVPSPELALGFDPMMLDPKQNAKLKADAMGVPAGLQFALEMDGKTYSHDAGGADKESFVPPGVHEFRVTAKSGSVEEKSNTVSTEFKLKKRYTLKVELRLKGMPASAGTPQGLYPNSEIVISLK